MFDPRGRGSAWQGIVVYLRSGHVGRPFYQVQSVHHIGLAGVKVDGARMTRLIDTDGIHRPEHPASARRINNHKRTRSSAADADIPRRIASPTPEPTPTVLNLSQFAQHIQHLIGRFSEKAVDLVVGNWQFVCCASQMVGKNVGVCCIHHGLFVACTKEVCRVAHYVLIHWIIQSDEDRQRLLGSAARPTGLLPDSRDRSGISSHNDSVQPSHVNTHLQRRGRSDTKQFSGEEAFLDLPALLWTVAGTIGHDSLAFFRTSVLECRPRVTENQLCCLASLGEHDGASV